MKRTAIRAFALLALAAAALAQNPHFIRVGAALDAECLDVSFKAAGLGTGPVDITASATVSVTYACINRSGKNPSAANKRTFVSDVMETGVFNPDKRGNFVGTLTLCPPSAEELEFSCPGGQELRLVSVRYENVQLFAPGTSASIGGAFERTFITLR